MEHDESLALNDSQLKLGFRYAIKLKRNGFTYYQCSKHDSKYCKAKFKVVSATGKVEEADLDHSDACNKVAMLTLV